MKFLFNNIFYFGKEFIHLSYYNTGLFLVGLHWFGAPLPKLQTFSGILWILPLTTVYMKKQYWLFLICYLQKVTTAKVELHFSKQCTVKPQHVLFTNKPLLCKMLESHFSYNISLYIEKKILWKNCTRLWKWNLKA